MSSRINRRDFMKGATVAAGAAALPALQGCTTTPRRVMSPNEKLNIGVIGVGGRGRANLDGVRHENVVALCDIDDRILASAQRLCPEAQTFNDYRQMIDMDGLDAVVISTPDHNHAPATLLALDRGLPVYCEKPLTHDIHEARTVTLAAAKAGVATQMGTQIHSNDNYRRAVELVQYGVLGTVREVHVWIDKSWGGDRARPSDTPPVPEHIHWDLWLGPAPERPYNPCYLPQNWRRWWEFGGGTIGDMGCHYTDLPFWALGLKHPATIEASGPPVDSETTPDSLKVVYEYAAEGDRPPLTLTWYDGGLNIPAIAKHNLPKWNNGVLFIGDRGMLLADYDRHQLFPEADFAGFTAPNPWIPSSIGHHQEWINACKFGTPTLCNFAYAGPLTEHVLLGNLAYRLGKRIEWDAARLRATNAPEAAELIRRPWRKGWSA